MAKLIMPGTSSQNISKQPPEDKTLSTWNPLRYAAKIPTYLYETFRSAPGLQAIQRNEDYLRQLTGQEPNQYPVAVSPEQAAQEAKQVLPNIMTQKLSEDWLARGLTKELPMAWATGGLASLPAAGKYAASAATGYLGSELGGAVGGKPGALIGGILGAGVPEYITARKTIAPLAPKSKQEDIRNYEENITKINNQAKKWYDKANTLERGEVGDARILLDVINKEKEKVFKGLQEPEQQQIQKLIYQLEDAIQRNKGQLSLNDAKQFKENYNHVIFSRSTEKPVKRAMQRVNEPLRKFIDDIGSPEHTKAYNKADQLYQKMFAQIKEEPQVIKEMNELRRSIEQSQKKGILDLVLQHKGLSTAASAMGSGLLSMLGVPYAGITAGITGAATGGLALYRESKMLADAAKNKPKLFKQFANTLAEATVDNTLRTINRLNNISQKIAGNTSVPSKKKKGLTLPNQ